MYKNCDESKVAEREAEIEQVKSDMESEKTKRVLEAKERMQELKKKLQAEKQELLANLKSNLAQSRPGQRSVADIGDVEVMEIDDTFGNGRSPLRVGEDIADSPEPGEKRGRRQSFHKNPRVNSNSPNADGARAFAKSLLPTAKQNSDNLLPLSKSPDVIPPKESLEQKQEEDEMPVVVEIDDADDIGSIDVDMAEINVSK